MVDLKGKIFGRLTVIEYAGKSGHGNVIWKCKCICGKTKNILSHSLIRGTTRSCGCYHLEFLRGQKRIWKPIVYKNYLKIPLTKGFFCKIDKCDFEKVKTIAWYFHGKDYASMRKRETNKNILMHRYLLDVSDNKEVDHINGDPLDNRRNNLRMCSRSENCCNKRIQSNNTSGVPGVCWDKNRNKWMVRVKKNKKVYSVGRFDLFKDAVKAREKKAKELHKNFYYKG